MIEPNRNDRCATMPASTHCDHPARCINIGIWNRNDDDRRVTIDAVNSASIIQSTRKAAAEGTIIDWIALNKVMRLTCWA